MNRSQTDDATDTDDTTMNPIDRIRSRLSSSTDTETDDAPPADHKETEVRTRAVDPAGVKLDVDAAQVGDRWATTLFVASWPDHANPGFLERVATHPSADVDISIHADPRDDTRAMKEFEGAIRDLQSVKLGKQQNGDPSLDATVRRLNEHREVLEQLTDGSQSVFDVSVYLTIRGDTEDTVERFARSLTNDLARQQVTLKRVSYRQEDGLVAGSPVAYDPFGRDVDAARTPMLGGALGATFPFSANTILEESGVLVGYHATTDSPVLVDRFARPNGYNVLTAGIIGAGKSFGTKALLLRQLAKDPDTVLIMIDPLEGFRALSDALDAERVVIGGRRGLNPLEIKRTPSRVLEDTPDLNPYGQRFSSVMGFFESYFGTLGVDLGQRRSVLGTAVNAAYYRKGITPDPSTHGEPSPTVRDVYDVLGEISEDAGKFLEADAERRREYDEDREDAATDDDSDAPEAVETPDPATATAGEIEKWEDRAEDLRIDMRPFISGEYANLAGESDVDIRDEKAVYLDLQQGEGDREIALMMKLLLDTVYERAKETDKRVILAIDEAHYLMQNGGSLDWLERLVRHSRHYDLSLHLVTQKAGDFFIHEKAKTIADNCSQKILHRLPGLSDEHADLLGLSEREAEFVRKAKPGTRERGYSHALVDVQDKTALPVKVTALPEEAALIESDDESEQAGRGDVAGVGVSR